MEIEVGAVPGTGTVITLHGEVDLDAAGAVGQAVRQSLDSDVPPVLLVDLTDVTFMDSSGLNALIRANQSTGEAGGAVHLVAPQETVARVLQLTGVDQVMAVHPDLPRALAAATVR